MAYKLPSEMEKKYNTPAQMYHRNKTGGDCPLCGRRHSYKAKSDRCYYCGQKLFVEHKGFIPEDNEEVIIVDQYTNGSYTNMIPDSIVLDYTLSTYWKVVFNNGAVVRLKNCKSGISMEISDDTSHMTFVLLAKKQEVLKWA